MATSTTSGAKDTATDSIAGLLPSWRRSLAARRVSPRTIATYSTIVEQLDAFLAGQRLPRRASAVTRGHLEAWITDLLARRSHRRHRPQRRGLAGPPVPRSTS